MPAKDNFALRRVIRTKRLIDAISPVEVANLKNRLTASRMSKNYNERTHVDVPADLLERVIALLEMQAAPVSGAGGG